MTTWGRGLGMADFRQPPARHFVRRPRRGKAEGARHDATPRVQFASTAAHLPSRAQVRRWALAAHAGNAGAGDGVVTIRYVDEKRAAPEPRFPWQGLRNERVDLCARTPHQQGGQHRSSFVIGHSSCGAAADIAICAPVIAREAASRRNRCTIIMPTWWCMACCMLRG